MNYAQLKGAIDAYESKFSTWHKRADNIVRRYEDERPANSTKSKLNILWSNVQTLQPALYNGAPNPNVDRRNQDDDDMGRIVSEVLERSAKYFIKQEAFDDVMRQCVLDRLLGGRGVAWARYKPVIGESVMITNNQGEEEEQQGELYSEDVIVDYVDSRDFGHNVARIWTEVHLVWRCAYLSRRELIKRFPKHGEQIPLDVKNVGDDTKADEGKKSRIYEMWDSEKKQVYWIHKEYQHILDEKPDPLHLKGFFPCPKPIYATLSNKSLIPTPDYVQYQDHANELDNLTGRINALTKVLKVAGVYDSTAEGVQKLLSDGVVNTLIPISSWAAFSQQGGLKGVIDFLPIEQASKVLLGLYGARDREKQIIFEITGISDIIRGATDPNETLGAQELKGKYAGLRLGAMQRDVARFARDLVEITVEIVAEHFDLETIKQITGVKLLTNAEKQQIQMQVQQWQMMAQQQAQQAQMMQQPAPPPPPPPVTKKMMDLMKNPSWEDVEGVIRKDMPRCFIIDIETESTIKADQDAEKAARTEFLTVTGGFIREATAVASQAPELKPLLMEMLLFGVRGFKAGRELESTFKNVMDDIREQEEQPQPPQQPQINPQLEAAKVEAQAKAEMLGIDMDYKQREFQSKSIILDKQHALKEKEIAYREGTTWQGG